MSLDIPNIDPFSTALMKGLTFGETTANHLAQSRIEQARNEETHANNQALRQQAKLAHALELQKYHTDLSRQKKELDIKAQEARDAHEKIIREMDPEYEAKQLNAIRMAFHSQQTPSQTPQSQNNNNLNYSPMGAPEKQQVIQGLTNQGNNGLSDSMIDRIAIKKVTGIDPGEDPQEKINRAVQEEKEKSQVKNDSLQNASNLKKSQESFSANKDIIHQLKGVDVIDHALQTDPGIFGFGSETIGKFSNDPNRGIVKTMALPLIQNLIKTLSSKGGAVVAKMAESYKPSISDTPGVLAGKMYGLRLLSQQVLGEESESYKKLTNQDMDLKGLNDFLNMKYENPAEVGPYAINQKSDESKNDKKQNFEEGFTKKIGNNSYIWTGGAWHRKI